MNIAVEARGVARRVADGESVHAQWDVGSEMARAVADELRLLGYRDESGGDRCSKASNEYHLVPDRKRVPRGRSVEVVSACFMGPFTLVRTRG